MTELSRDDCRAMDASDPLASLRQQFVLPEATVYLDGNSLGLMPRAAAERARQVVEQEWGQGLIRSWNEAGWWQLPTRLGDKIAALVGAEDGEVVVTDGTGINLFKALALALQLRPERRVILLEGSNFPTNNYIAEGLASLLHQGYTLRYAEESELDGQLNDDVAVLCLTQVHFRSGRKLDMAAWTARAHAVGALTVWDLCHSAGAFPVDLQAAKVDFAVGCTYKYLNGGPGSPGFVYVAKRHHGQAAQPLTGWWGHVVPFAFERDYRPAQDIRQMLSGTQPIISLSVAEAGIDLFAGVDLQQLQAKSTALTGLFMQLVDQRLPGAFTVLTPREADKRGSQVALSHSDGYAMIQALIARKVIGDFRAPDVLRFGFAPLYVSYSDVWDAVQQLLAVVESREYQRPEFSQRAAVT